MPSVRPYCSITDVKELLPYSIGAQIESSDIVITDEKLDSLCLEVTAEMDFRIYQAGYETPINIEDDPDSLLALNLKRIAATGVAGRVERILKQTGDDPAASTYFEKQYYQDIGGMVKKGIPQPAKKRFTIADALAPATGSTGRKPTFTRDGINYS